MDSTTNTPSNDEGTPAEPIDRTERTYADYKEEGQLSFDPMAELNLPSSYDEVVSRFSRLQGNGAMEVLN